MRPGVPPAYFCPAHAAVYFRHCLEDLSGQAAVLQRQVERLETVTLDAISLEVSARATFALACRSLRSCCQLLSATARQRRKEPQPSPPRTPGSAPTEDLRPSLHARAMHPYPWQELAGHCTELHGRNAAGIAALEAHLRRYGYSGGDFPPHIPAAHNEPENQPPAQSATTATEPRLAGGKGSAAAAQLQDVSQQLTQRRKDRHTHRGGQRSAGPVAQTATAACPLGAVDNVLSQRSRALPPQDAAAHTAEVDASAGGACGSLH